MMTMRPPAPRILFVSAHLPHSEGCYGAQLRSLHIARILASRARVRLAIFPFGPVSDGLLERNRGEFDVAGVFHLERDPTRSLFARWFRELDRHAGGGGEQRLPRDEKERFDALAETVDLIWFQGISIPNALGRRHWPGAVLDIDDIPSQVHRARAREASKASTRLKEELKRRLWTRRESVLPGRFDRICVCSADDRRYLGGGERIRIVPNGFEAPNHEIERRPADPPRLGFIGTLRYRPNREGIEWFLREVWPRIRARRPDARLRLVGAETDAGVAATAEGVDGLGFVPDADAEIATWAVSVVPILIGGGTRIKIAEAFAKGCPLVSTRLGAYGYELSDGVECRLADRPDDFAAACLSLIEQPELGERMARRARERFDRFWSWDAIAPKVLDAAGIPRREPAPLPLA